MNPVFRDAQDASDRAVAEAARGLTPQVVADYLDFLVERGDVEKKRNKFRPTVEFGLKWADAILAVIARKYPEPPLGDLRGEVALEMAIGLLGVSKKSIETGKNPEEVVRLTTTILSLAKPYFPADLVSQIYESEKGTLDALGSGGLSGFTRSAP